MTGGAGTDAWHDGAWHDGLSRAFDARSESYVRSRWHVAYAERLVQIARPTPGSAVLDAACGTGFATRAAARAVGAAGRVIGVDISTGMLQRARATSADADASPIDWREGDATALPGQPVASLDLVLCAAGLLYLPVHAALTRWRAVLCDGGRVAFSTMRAGYPVGANLFREHAARFGLLLADPAEPLGSESSCRRVLADAGLRPVDIVAEQVEFSPADLAGAWEAHVRGPHHEALATLTDAQREDFRTVYTAAIGHMLTEEPGRICVAEVIYAVGQV